MRPAGSGLLAIGLGVCAAGALWLLLSPAAFHRRILTRRVARLEEEKRAEWAGGIALEHRRDGLEGDPSVIEKAARRLGYGRVREYTYPLSQERLSAMRRRVAANAERSLPSSEPGRVRRLTVSAVALLIGGAMAILFFAGLKVEDPGMRHDERPNRQHGA